MASKLTFYLMTASPPARAVHYLAKYLGLDFEVKEVDLLGGEQFSEEFSKLNPAHKVPILIDGDFVLSESRAIMVYLLSTKKPGSDLYPTDPQTRAVVDQKLYYDATIVFKALAALVVNISLKR